LLDVTNSLAELGEFVDACLHCWQEKVPYGTYNVVNSGAVTTRDVVELIKKHRIVDRDFKFFLNEAEFMQKAGGAPRSSCVLGNSKLLGTRFVISEIHAAIAKSLSSWNSA
jgi:nucleoside-diphosphate-sugar epimerase